MAECTCAEPLIRCDTHGKRCAICGGEERVALTRPATQPSEGERSWRCFHCDEVFTDKNAAREHFGSTELDEPGCKMLAKGEIELLRDYRDMAARWQRCVSEDCEASRVYHSMSAKIATTEREAEQRGYDKGLNDARLAASRVPEGWQLVPKEPTKEMMKAFWLAGPYPAKPFIDGYAAMLAKAAAPAPEEKK